MEYAVAYGKGKYKDGFKTIYSARKHAYNIVGENDGVGIYKRATYSGDEYYMGDVNRVGSFYFYREWPSEKRWVLNKDGSLGKRIR